MNERKCVVYFVVVACLWRFHTAANYCVVMETCILPCSFTPGDELVLHWIQGLAGITPVHSFYHNKDQLALQNPSFKGRTSLFPDQIPRGNASLKLRRVQVRDEGRYKCYSSTITGNAESFVELNVEAPVGAVVLQQLGNRISCSSEGIYPQPELSWSSSPPSPETNPQDKPTVQKTDEQLYSITSSITTSNRTDVVYSCTVSARGKGRRTSLFKTNEVKYSLNNNATIHCTPLKSPVTQLTWRFDHSEVILTRVGADGSASVSDGWRQQVEASESGSLTLTHLSPRREGTYTCEVSNAQETYVTSTILRMEEEEETTPDSDLSTGGITAAVVGSVCVVLISIGVWFYCSRKKSPDDEAESQGVQLNQREEMLEMQGLELQSRGMRIRSQMETHTRLC